MSCWAIRRALAVESVESRRATLFKNLRAHDGMNALKAGYLSFDKYIVEGEGESNRVVIRAFTHTRMYILSLRIITLANQSKTTILALADVPSLVKLFMRLQDNAEKDVGSLPPQTRDYTELRDYMPVNTFASVLKFVAEAIPAIQVAEPTLYILVDATNALHWAAGRLPECLSWPDMIRKVWSWPASNLFTTLEVLSRTFVRCVQASLEDPAIFPWSEVVKMCQGSIQLLLLYYTISDSDLKKLFGGIPGGDEAIKDAVANAHATLSAQPQHLVASVAMRSLGWLVNEDGHVNQTVSEASGYVTK